jgi:hypothetical protein
MRVLVHHHPLVSSQQAFWVGQGSSSSPLITVPLRAPDDGPVQSSGAAGVSGRRIGIAES